MKEPVSVYMTKRSLGPRGGPHRPADVGMTVHRFAIVPGVGASLSPNVESSLRDLSGDGCAKDLKATETFPSQVRNLRATAGLRWIWYQANTFTGTTTKVGYFIPAR